MSFLCEISPSLLPSSLSLATNYISLFRNWDVQTLLLPFFPWVRVGRADGFFISFNVISVFFSSASACVCVCTTYSRRSQTRQDTPTRKGRSIHPWEERGKGRTARGGDPLMWLKSFSPLLIAKCKYMVFSYHSQHTHAHAYNSIRPLSLSCLWESLLPFRAATRSFSCERKCIESLSGRRTNNNVYLFKSQ